MSGKSGEVKKRRKRVQEAPEAERDKEEPKPRGYGERKILEQLPKIDFLEFGECLGFGHFSHVYEGVYKKKYPAAIKIIERGSERLVEKEISLLRTLKGLPHIVTLYEVVNAENTLLVFELLKGLSTEQFFEQVTLDRLRFVLRCILEALAAAHANEIVHRDVKLGNILIAHDWSEVKLIDWGCGCPLRDKMSPKAGSRTCRSLEMLLGYDGYLTHGDLWSVGVFIYFVLCGGEIPWKCQTSWETVVKLASFFGRRNTLELANRYGVTIPEETVREIKEVKPQRLRRYYDETMEHLLDEDLIDLMHQLFNLDMETRISAEEALMHPFFVGAGDEYYYYSDE